MRRTTLALLVLIGLSYMSAVHGSDYNEAVDGDLSGDPNAPTVIDLDEGSNTITATSVSGDREYYTVNIPGGFAITAVVLTSYVSLDDVAFIAVQNGTIFTEPPTGTDVTQLLGWTHFGPPFVGTDILDDIGNGFDAMGFTPPLGSGDYVFWSQQTGSNATTYALDFQVTAVDQVPALSSVGMLVLVVGLGLAMLATLRRKRVRQI